LANVKKSSPLKLLGQMEPNLAGSIYVRSSIKLLHSDKVYQLLVHGQWFSLASSTTKTGRHDIAEILLKVALKLQKSNQINCHVKAMVCWSIFPFVAASCFVAKLMSLSYM
jgi:hypothetical protein